VTFTRKSMRAPSSNAERVRLSAGTGTDTDPQGNRMSVVCLWASTKTLASGGKEYARRLMDASNDGGDPGDRRITMSTSLRRMR
jgi:hypothetical protein